MEFFPPIIPEPDQIVSQGRMIYLIGECAILFIVAPVLLAIFKSRVSPIVPLLAVGAIVLVVLLNDPTFDSRRLTNFSSAAKSLPSILAIWVVITLGMILTIRILQPDQLFAFPRKKPKFWMIVMAFYPVFSVIPQTIIYRAFFLHRYQPLFGSEWTMLIVAALAFGLAHLVFRHILPIILTTIAGLLFAWRYASTGSAVASAFEHALYGDMVFTVGLGLYFYLGSQRLVEQVIGAELVGPESPAPARKYEKSG